MKITENFDLSTLSSFKIGGKAKYLIEIEKEEELAKIVEIKENERLPIIIVGDGTNTVFNDGEHNKIFVKIVMNDILKVYEDKEWVNIDVGAGVNWDKLVDWTVKKKLSGLELLSGIPGSVGASPIQNIGAYGGEIAESITHVRVFDLDSKEFYEINNRECDFKYRDSFFKRSPNRFIITKVSFRLAKNRVASPTYKDLALYFLAKKNRNPTIKEIRTAVLEIRAKKLADPKKIPNCGSFFKNPIIDHDKSEILIKKFKDMPHWSAGKYETKLSGGWLIEMSGFKGKDFGNIKVSEKNALVLLSNGKASFRDLIEAIEKIQEGVKKNFNINLEIEPNLIK